MKPYFIGSVQVEWLGNGRDMKLLDDFAFVDSAGKGWHAPKDHVINGASVPKFFWRLIGSPFVGLYRDASVIHYVYCDTRSEPYEAVHRMFYEAMKCREVPKTKRVAMYNAVAWSGPKWDEDGNDLIIEPLKFDLNTKSYVRDEE